MANDSDDFKKAEAEIDGELHRRGKQTSSIRTEEEFRKRVTDLMQRTFNNIKIGDAFYRNFDNVQEAYRAAYSHIPNINYSLADVVRLCSDEHFHEDNSWHLGFFVSALINRLIRDGDVITIKPRPWVSDSYMGLFLERGTLVIDGLAHMALGIGQKGGKIIAKGSVEGYGNHLEGDGELVIEMVYGGGFNHMKGGHGIIKGIFSRPMQYPPEYKYPEGSFWDGLGAYQKGGKLEILCDVPYIAGTEAKGIGYKQEDGAELLVIGNVFCPVNMEQKGGKTHIRGNVDGPGAGVAELKKGGTTVIDRDVGSRANSEKYFPTHVGCRQQGGFTEVKGDVYGSVGYDGYPNAEIKVHGSVFGEVAGYETVGTKIFIDGNVVGDVACHTRNIYCVIGGNVTGKVACGLGHYNRSTTRRESYLEIKGGVRGDVGENLAEPSRVRIRNDVYGTVGEGMSGGRIDIDGGIERVGRCFGGKIYQNGRDITNVPLWVEGLKLLFGKK